MSVWLGTRLGWGACDEGESRGGRRRRHECRRRSGVYESRGAVVVEAVREEEAELRGEGSEDEGEGEQRGQLL